MALSPARTQTILDAAQELILKHGLRGTSMQAIATKARIAKPTLYAYFPDKAAVFDALLDRLIGQWREEFVEALRGDGDLAQRVAAALIAKNKAMRRLLAGSPHADELYGEHDKGGAARFAAFEADLGNIIERELVAAGVTGARLNTQVLLAASYGIGRRAQSTAEFGPALRLVVERVLRPDLPR